MSDERPTIPNRPMSRRRFFEIAPALIAVVGGFSRDAGSSMVTSRARAQSGSAHVGTARSRPPLDLLLRGGMVVDGTGSPPRRADVGLREGRIVAVDLLPDADAAEVIDVSGHVVSPGFIDIHGHTDLEIFVDPHADSKVRQGVTLEVVGQDGSSVAPVSPKMRTERAEHYAERYGMEIEFDTWEEFIDQVEATGMLTHLATMVGMGTVREAIVGNEDRPPTGEEMRDMVAEIEHALSIGAVGVSSGLEYTPNAYAAEDELIALARSAADLRLPYATHMRNEADTVEEALEEAIEIARLAGVPLQVSHLKAQGERNWPKAARLLETIERAARERAVHFDRYPYTAYSTGLASLFPAWAKDGGTDRFIERLEDPSEEGRLRGAVDEKIAMMGAWDAIQIATIDGEGDPGAAGRRLGSYASDRGIDPYEAAVELIVRSENRVGIVGHGMSEANTRAFVVHRLGAICSDASVRRSTGPLSEGTPHPRAYGAFPRVLGQYVREEGALSLEEAIRKMTSLPAEILGIADRGRIEPGLAADLVVFDPETVADTATFTEPHQYPVGLPHVVVGGALAVQGGKPTGELPGRFLTG